MPYAKELNYPQAETKCAQPASLSIQDAVYDDVERIRSTVEFISNWNVRRLMPAMAFDLSIDLIHFAESLNAKLAQAVAE